MKRRHDKVMCDSNDRARRERGRSFRSAFRSAGGRRARARGRHVAAQQGCRNEQHNESRHWIRQLRSLQTGGSAAQAAECSAIAAQFSMCDGAIGFVYRMIVREIADAVQHKAHGQHCQQCSRLRTVSLDELRWTHRLRIPAARGAKQSFASPSGAFLALRLRILAFRLVAKRKAKMRSAARQQKLPVVVNR